MEDWPHQVFAVNEVAKAIENGEKRICVTSPTGGGKSRIMQRIIEWGRKTVLATNRTMLVEQLADDLNDAGIYFGMHASGYAPSVFEPVQIASLQTLHSWWKSGVSDLPEAEIFILDEGHNEKGPRSCEIIDEYEKRGAVIIIVTATPVNIGHMATHLIQAGYTSDLRKCGALVPVYTYAPDELDSRVMKKSAKSVVQLKEEYKEVILPVIFGRVIEHYHKLNPNQKPAILFAPGVQESRWFCERFNAEGVPWSHIDSKSIILNGIEMPANKETRRLLSAASRTGKTKGVSNRFVMREGVNYPWLYHLIYACLMGSLQAFLQSGGRILRQHYIDGEPQLDHTICQDHGGNFWRFDSLNADREWLLSDTDQKIQDAHDSAYRTKEKSEPIVCPKCAMVRSKGARCPKCGFAYEGRRRMVIQTNGRLREVKGDIYKPRKQADEVPELVKNWLRCVYRCKNSNRTFNQARALFQRENRGLVPADNYPMIPLRPSDWYENVGKVPHDRLTGKQAN